MTGGYPYEPVIDLTDPLVMRERVLAASAASAGGYFWLPCPLCGLEFGGHEWLRGTAQNPSSIRLPGDAPGASTGICPFCTMAGRGRQYRESNHDEN